VIYEKAAEVTLNNLFKAYAEWCIRGGRSSVERFKSRAFGTYFEDRGHVERFKNSAGWAAFKGAQLATDRGSEVHDPIPRLSNATREYRKVCESPSEPLNLCEVPRRSSAPRPWPSRARSPALNFRGHQFRHVRDGAGWRCLECSPASA